MCGRIKLSTPVHEFVSALDVTVCPELPQRYNIAPTQQVPLVRRGPAGNELVCLRWGLIPSWAESPAIGNRMINAKAETITSKPAFRAGFKHRRCVVIADGFYEWKAVDGIKQPYLITLRQPGPFGLAGVWERWTGPDSTVVESFTIITTSANDLLQSIHDRMPVILGREACAAWLRPDGADAADLVALLKPFSADEMALTAVSTRVNSPRYDDAQCSEPC